MLQCNPSLITPNPYKVQLWIHFHIFTAKFTLRLLVVFFFLLQCPDFFQEAQIVEKVDRSFLYFNLTYMRVVQKVITCHFFLYS